MFNFSWLSSSNWSLPQVSRCFTMSAKVQEKLYISTVCPTLHRATRCIHAQTASEIQTLFAFHAWTLSYALTSSHIHTHAHKHRITDNLTQKHIPQIKFMVTKMKQGIHIYWMREPQGGAHYFRRWRRTLFLSLLQAYWPVWLSHCYQYLLPPGKGRDWHRKNAAASLEVQTIFSQLISNKNYYRDWR